MQRAILHVDLDAFFASVEEILRPDLRGQPIVVGGSGQPDQNPRGVVSSASYAARAFGVHSAMPLAVAVRLCPQAVFLPVHHDLYARYSRRVMELLRRFTPMVEQVSIDEAFLDLSTRRWDEAVGEARNVQAAIRHELELSGSIGLSTTKLAAKIASDQRKPGGFTNVPPGTEADFLAPLPIERLWGVGPRTAEKLHQLGLRTNGDLAAAPDETLRRLLGPSGAELSRRARGVDLSPLQISRATRSVTAEHTFPRDMTDHADVERRLRSLSDDVAAALRRNNLAGKTIMLKLRYRTFETLTRSTTLLVATDQESQIFVAALHLLRRTWVGQTPVRLVGVGVHSLSPARVVQPSLFAPPDLTNERLTGTIDLIRNRFGPQAISRGSVLPQHRR